MTTSRRASFIPRWRRSWSKGSTTPVRSTARRDTKRRIPEDGKRMFCEKRAAIARERERFRKTRPKLTPEFLARAEALGLESPGGSLTLEGLLRRPELDYEAVIGLAAVEGHPDAAVREQVEIKGKYEGYIHRQTHEVANYKRLETRQ